MAPRITFIKDIKAGKIDWRIKVRVLHMWKIPEYNNPNVTKSMEIVLLDEKSGKIQASIKQNLLDMFENTLEEGSCYLIQNLLVAQNDPKFRATDHKYKLTFMRTTMCMKTDAAMIPENVFKFVTFPEICTGLDETYLIDVIGHVVQRHDMKETEKNGVRSLLMDIVLEDLQGNRIDCTLWGTYGEKMHNYLLQNTENGLVVVILQGCKMRIFNGKIGISTSFDATKLLINPDLKECTGYKEKLENGNRSVTPGVSYISGQSSMSITDDFLQTPRMTISDIMDVDKEIICVVFAKIIDFDTSMGWYYDACTKCAKKVTQRVGKLYYCGKCANMVLSYPRCKIHVQVIDLTGSTYFTLFDRHATQYLGDSASSLFESVEKGRDDGAWPKAFDVLLNKDMLFKIQATQQSIDNNWQTYTVKKVSADANLIDQFKKLHGIKDDEDTDVQNIVSAEVGDNIKVPLPVNNEEILQITDVSPAVNDLKVDSIANTPCADKNKGKRIFEEVDFGSPVDGCGTQNSSTKMPKLNEIKKEPSE